MQVARLALLACLVAGPVAAHSPVPGFEGLYVGLLHPYSTPAQGLLILSSALATGSFAAERARWLLLTFLLATIGGLLIGPQVTQPDLPLLLVAIGLSTLAALVPGRALLLVGAALALGAALIGQVSIPDAGPWRDRAFTMTGSLIGANLGLVYLFGLAHVLRTRFAAPWIPVAFRVTAAWVAAIALILLALTYAAPPAPL